MDTVTATKRPETQEMHDEMIKSCIQIGVLFKVDSWHSARMLHREINRLGTRKVAFHVVGMRFGELTADDIMFFGRAMKIAVCYRTPLGLSTDLDQYLEINDTWVLQTDDITEVILFLKWCAVALHKEHAPDDYGVTERSHKSYLVLMKDKSGKSSEKKTDQQKNSRHRRLLVTPNFSIQICKLLNAVSITGSCSLCPFPLLDFHCFTEFWDNRVQN
ncbi:putative translation initiation factor IF-2 [Trypanosoma cruzi]|uniref:Putative translation initiation factor IF-2 n=1 Tax=Trypanosoma cruzi TaxID=5693 RepID=A0A2V2VD12_TRYCR|nr:putative translation initiation factor IF-2 [Trypanosoma cruzi]